MNGSLTALTAPNSGIIKVFVSRLTEGATEPLADSDQSLAAFPPPQPVQRIVSPDPESPPWGWECRSVSPTVGNRDSACWGSDPETESACVRLSPSDDICVLTSNIEQLAHNISSDWTPSVQGTERRREQSSAVHLSHSTHHRDVVNGDHAEDKAEERTRGDVTAAITAGFHSLQSQSSHTTDASVQTDFADDEDDDLANSDSDWFLGAGSGCVTEEEGAADEESSVGEDGEDRKLWMIPDCMQDSTDTGYSSLSRDGQVDIDDELNDAYVENNSARNDNDPGRALLSWHHAPGCMDDPSNVSPSADDSGDLFDQPSDKLCAHSAPFASRDRPGPQREEQVSHDGGSGPVSYEDDFRGNLFVGTGDPLGRSDPDFAEFCCCDDSFSDLFDQHNRSGPASVPARRVITSRHRQSHYDNMVPYPYDVTRFGDVIHDEQGTVSATSTAKEVTSETSAGSSEGRSCPHSSTPSYARTTAHSHADFAAEATTGSSFSPFLFQSTTPHAGIFHGAESLPSPIPHSSASPSTMFSPHPPHPSSSGRSLRDVTASLEDKVFFLRQGKQLVNRKIREAREEEMLRQQQKLRFQRLLDIHRKHILLETLQDLRQRLESQSARLQASYSAVLDIQKRYA
nr:hypothetical protein BaRGS_003067 [Batillaria attramentaria]